MHRSCGEQSTDAEKMSGRPCKLEAWKKAQTVANEQLDKLTAAVEQLEKLEESWESTDEENMSCMEAWKLEKRHLFAESPTQQERECQFGLEDRASDNSLSTDYEQTGKYESDEDIMSVCSSASGMESL